MLVRMTVLSTEFTMSHQTLSLSRNEVVAKLCIMYNPYLGDKQGPTFPDFDDDGYLYTICCEPTLSGKNAVTLNPGEAWEEKQEIDVPIS